MGLLDDAIREHLELKRLHGADPTEVAKQEQEALGPVRRGEPADPSTHALAEEEERSYEESVLDAGDDPLEHAPLADDPAAHPRRSLLDPDEPPATAVAEPAEPVESTPEPFAVETPPAPAPEPAPEPPAPTEPDPDPEPGQDTVAFSALEELEVAEPSPVAEPPAPAPASDERPRAPAPPPVDAAPVDGDPADDELAETPEFLQETPEHDRLWFEQKPPRDFDF